MAAKLSLIGTVAQAVTFSDQDFFSEDWTPIIHVHDDPLTTDAPPLTSAGNMTRQTSGGDPGAYFQSGHIVNSGDAINTSGIYIEETYDPSEQAVSSLNFAYSVNHFNTAAGTSTDVLPALLQDGRLFVGPDQSFSGNTWVTRSQSGLDADDFFAADIWFTGAIIHPDFSAFGETIQFGYSLQNRVAFGSGFTATRGVDNWSVTINLAPMSDPLGDGVGANDLALWESGFGIASDALLVDGDFDRDDDVDGADFLKWQREHGTMGALQAVTIPEPATLLLVCCGILLFSPGVRIRENNGQDDDAV